MKLSTQGVIAAFWLLFWSIRILVDYDRMIRTENGRLFLILYALAIALGLLFIAYLAMKKYGPKALYSVNRSSRCPDCYSKLRKGEDFCPKCGKDLREREEARICWFCGYEELNKNSTSCPKCGREYKK